MAANKDKRAAFVEEYLLDLSPSKAAVRAGYSPKNSRHRGALLMKDPRIRAAIMKKLAARSQRTEVTADSVLKALNEIAQVDRSSAFRVLDGRLYLVDTELLPPEVRRCISEIAQTQHGIRIKFDDRVKALELLGRHLALFTDNLNLSGRVGGTIDEMTEEQIDAELARTETEEAPPRQT